MDVAVIERFYHDLHRLHIQVTSNSDDVLENIQNFHRRFWQKIESITIDPIIKKQNLELYEALDDILDNIKRDYKKWGDELDKIFKEESLLQELEDSFVVIIYGKVKAGKSTLGNFVAKNPVVQLLGYKPSFYIYDNGERKETKELAQIEEGFETDNLECTKEIQFFKLEALAWVDTPGLSSMTPQNEELAKKYIKAADFIIFPTSSDSPMQRNEIEELKELAKSAKNFYIVITKSDTFEEDEVDGEIVRVLVNKDVNRRRAQEEDVKKRLQEEGIEVENIFSISVLAAQKGLESGDEELFEGSNIKQFYNFLEENLIIKANRLKQRSRKKRLKSFIQKILDDIKKKRRVWISFLKSVKKLKRV